MYIYGWFMLVYGRHHRNIVLIFQLKIKLECRPQSHSHTHHPCKIGNIWLDCSLQGPSVHGIFQARVLEWLAISSSRGPFRPRGQTCVSSVYLHSQEASLLLAPPGKPTVYYISNLNENLRWFNLIHIFSVGTYFWSKFPNSLISNQVEYLYLLPERTAPLP